MGHLRGVVLGAALQEKNTLVFFFHTEIAGRISQAT